MSAARKLVSPALDCKAVEDLFVFYEAPKEVTTMANSVEGKKKLRRIGLLCSWQMRVCSVGSSCTTCLSFHWCQGRVAVTSSQ